MQLWPEPDTGPILFMYSIVGKVRGIYTIVKFYF